MKRKQIIAVIAFIILLLLIFCVIQQTKKVSQAPSPTPLAPTIGHRTKTSGCKVNGPLPDRACTPGAVIPGVTKEEVCTSGYAKSLRNVPESEKEEVFAEYEITHHDPGEYEVDHLISLELGGSNDIANLWLEAAEPRPGFHEKDRVENHLHKLVCNGEMSLEEAQRVIATDWLSVYEKISKK